MKNLKELLNAQDLLSQEQASHFFESESNTPSTLAGVEGALDTNKLKKYLGNLISESKYMLITLEKDQVSKIEIEIDIDNIESSLDLLKKAV